MHNNSKLLGLRKRSWIEAGSIGGPPSYLEGEDLLDDIVPDVSTVSLEAGKDGMPIALDEMKSISIIYDVDIWDLLEAQGGVAGDLLEGEVNFSLTELPQNLRNERSIDNSCHYVFTSENMSDFVEFIRSGSLCRKERRVLKWIQDLRLA